MTRWKDVDVGRGQVAAQLGPVQHVAIDPHDILEPPFADRLPQLVRVGAVADQQETEQRLRPLADDPLPRGKEQVQPFRPD